MSVAAQLANPGDLVVTAFEGGIGVCLVIERVTSIDMALRLGFPVDSLYIAIDSGPGQPWSAAGLIAPDAVLGVFKLVTPARIDIQRSFPPLEVPA